MRGCAVFSFSCLLRMVCNLRYPFPQLFSLRSGGYCRRVVSLFLKAFVPCFVLPLPRTTQHFVLLDKSLYKAPVPRILFWSLACGPQGPPVDACLSCSAWCLAGPGSKYGVCCSGWFTVISWVGCSHGAVLRLVLPYKMLSSSPAVKREGHRLRFACCVLDAVCHACSLWKKPRRCRWCVWCICIAP